jgi:hypothetical protein
MSVVGPFCLPHIDQSRFPLTWNVSMFTSGIWQWRTSKQSPGGLGRLIRARISVVAASTHASGIWQPRTRKRRSCESYTRRVRWMTNYGILNWILVARQTLLGRGIKVLEGGENITLNLGSKDGFESETWFSLSFLLWFSYDFFSFLWRKRFQVARTLANRFLSFLLSFFKRSSKSSFSYA